MDTLQGTLCQIKKQYKETIFLNANWQNIDIPTLKKFSVAVMAKCSIMSSSIARNGCININKFSKLEFI